jgi:hypothetical protein
MTVAEHCKRSEANDYAIQRVIFVSSKQHNCTSYYGQTTYQLHCQRQYKLYQPDPFVEGDATSQGLQRSLVM